MKHRLTTLVLALSVCAGAALCCAALCCAGPASADARPVLDYRDPTFRLREPRIAPPDRQRLERAMAEQAPEALRSEMGKTFVVLGDAAGAFSRAGAKERIFLVQAAAPVAIDPFPKSPAPVLVVLGEDPFARFLRLPADVQYQRLVGTADMDRDGRSEILLESSFMNMGEFTAAVTAIRLDPDQGTAAPVQVLTDVFKERCGRGATGAAGKSREASTISLGEDGRFTARRHTLGCR